MHNTEDKKYWVEKYGLNHEYRFIEILKDFDGYDLDINPDKKNSPTSIDFIWQEDLADLKTQTTPFFTSKRYGIDTEYAVTFNKIDYQRYLDYEKSTKKNVYVFFWIDWKQLTWKDKNTHYLFGIYYASLKNIKKMISDGAPEHSYIRRRFDTKGNAKSSFILDIRKFNSIIQNTNRENEKSDYLA